MSEHSTNNSFTTSRALAYTVIAILILLVSQIIAQQIVEMPILKLFQPAIYALLYIALVYCGLLLFSKKVTRLSLQECRIDRPRIKIKWLICAFVLPLVVIAFLLSTPGTFIQNEMHTTQAINVIMTAVFVTGFGAGVVEEIVFRGVIMKIFERRWGIKVAILVPSIIFGLLHTLGANLNFVDFVMLFIGGTSVGIMFSLIVYESGSVWNSAIVHGLWNIFVIGGIVRFDTVHDGNALFFYHFTSESLLLTGGSFGVEVSLVAILGYLTVIAIALRSMNKRKGA